VIRVVAIAWVIAHHAGQAYSEAAGDWPVADAAQSDWFAPFFFVNAAFGLGLLFILAGYFTPGSLDRKGSARFLKERWSRIGVPMVIMALAIHVPIGYFVHPDSPSLAEYPRVLFEEGLTIPYLHLWFLGHVLLYSLGYVLWRRYRDRKGSRPPRVFAPPGHRALLGFVVVLAVAMYIVRLWYPVNEWVPLLFVLAAEPAHLPQYVGLFAVGIVAYRSDWFNRMSTRVGMVWLGVGVAASIGYYVLAFNVDSLGDYVHRGGDTWQAGLYSTWESVICVGMCVGLIVLLRSVVRGAGPVMKAMAAASYAAYILHWIIVVGLQAGLEPIGLPAFVKFLIVTVLGITFAFGIAHLSRRVPGLNVVLGTKPQPEKRTGSSSDEAANPTQSVQ
jgi:peptidoglycan/LPS O-acetylase OafA/YrhL